MAIQMFVSGIPLEQSLLREQSRSKTNQPSVDDRSRVWFKMPSN
jgi:hypothetical protein